jgi:hypothetical protein
MSILERVQIARAASDKYAQAGNIKVSVWYLKIAACYLALHQLLESYE